jgi:hypothetical protein
LSYSRARGAFVGASIDGTSISIDQATEAMYYQTPGTIPASAMQLVQLVSKISSDGSVSARQNTSPATTTSLATVKAAPSSVETTRQQVDESSRQLAAILDDQWKKYLALPAEIYIPNHAPNIEDIQQAIIRYETVARQTQYAHLTNQPAFQDTLTGLWRLSHLRLGVQQ